MEKKQNEGLYRGGVVLVKATERHNNKYSTRLHHFFGKKKIREITAQTIPRFSDYTLKDLFIFILVLLITIALALFILNQFLELKFKQEFLLTPCELCTEMNRANSFNINWSNITIVSPVVSPAVLGSYPT